MPESLEHIVAGISSNPQRIDLLAGFIALCRTDKNELRQADSLVNCAKAVLTAQPLLSLKLLEVALAIAPKHPPALAMAKEIFRRRGRWSSEQRIAELMSTQTLASALTPLPDDLKASVVDTATKVPAQQPEMEKVPDDLELSLFKRVPLPEPKQAPTQEQESAALPEPKPAAIPQTTDDSQQHRVNEYLERCGFDGNWSNLSTGFSKNNAGLVSFVGMLVGMNMIKADERTLAGIMLLKMINEKPDGSGAHEILERLFPELVHSNREGK
ncbi:MAG: hypothetical protein FJY29_11375 [Betaproteobacteria bacterium]|nr:hypothetical protein [Betaproteobacteria bacterium]